MAFWGANDTQKNATGRIGELGNWSYAKMPEWYDKANRFENQAGYWTNKGADYWGGLMDQGGPGVAQNRDTGKAIMPYDDVMSRRNARDTQTLESFQQLPSADQTAEKIGNWTDQYGGAITNNLGQNQDSIINSWKRNQAGNEGASRNIVSNIGDTYGKLGDWANKDFGAMRGTNAGVYDALYGASDKTFNGMNDLLSRIMPGGEFQQAQVARSYAPEMASTVGRLRAAGASPGATQEAVSAVERDRARGMDEAAGRTTQAYVDQATRNALNELNNRENLSQSQLANELNLAREQNQKVSDYTESGAGQFRNELLRSMLNNQGLDTAATDRILSNNNQGMDRTTDYFKQRMANDQLLRAMQQQDWGTVASILGQQNATDLLGVNLGNEQYDRGNAQNMQDIGVRNLGASNITNLGNQQYQNMFGAANLGRGFGNDALQQYLASYGIESPNAGWGTKLLGGLGLSALTGGLGGGWFGGGGGGFQLPVSQISRN